MLIHLSKLLLVEVRICYEPWCAHNAISVCNYVPYYFLGATKNDHALPEFPSNSSVLLAGVPFPLIACVFLILVVDLS
jgi:hypothetical protein